MRIEEKFSCERDQICLARIKYLLRMSRLGDESDCDRFDARLFSHTLCVGNVITRHTRHDSVLIGPAYSAGRTGYDVNAAMRQFACKRDRVVHRPASFGTICRRATEKQRPVLRPYRSHGLAQVISRAKRIRPFQIAAVGVVTPVREWAEELMDQKP